MNDRHSRSLAVSRRRGRIARALARRDQKPVSGFYAAPFLLTLVVLLSLTAGVSHTQRGEWIGKGRTWEWESKHLEAKIVVDAGVFPPAEAENRVLPLMAKHPELFEGKKVLEIGTGSGIISLFAAKPGAARVVSTDISELAVSCAKSNAELLGFSSQIDVRLVPPDDISAYSVFEAGESFDVIISNPPYALDIHMESNDPFTDRGDLGLSIVRGLDQHLTPSGVAVLLYGSFFYHQVMAKFARYEGFRVRNNIPHTLVPWEARTLFNSYLTRFLPGEKLAPDAFSFSELESSGVQIRARKEKPLFSKSDQSRYPGFIVIRHPAGAGVRPSK